MGDDDLWIDTGLADDVAAELRAGDGEAPVVIAARHLGITFEAMRARAAGEFRRAPEESDEVLDLRQRHNDRRRVRLARDLRAKSDEIAGKMEVHAARRAERERKDEEFAARNGLDGVDAGLLRSMSAISFKSMGSAAGAGDGRRFEILQQKRADKDWKSIEMKRQVIADKVGDARERKWGLLDRRHAHVSERARTAKQDQQENLLRGFRAQFYREDLMRRKFEEEDTRDAQRRQHIEELIAAQRAAAIAGSHARRKIIVNSQNEWQPSLRNGFYLDEGGPATRRLQSSGSVGSTNVGML